MSVVVAGSMTSTVSLICDSTIDCVASMYSLMRILSHLSRLCCYMVVVDHRWAFTIGHGMSAQRIETNMFVFPSHPFEIFLEFHFEIEGKKIHQ